MGRLVRKGGYEVLDTVPLNEKTQYKVEALLKPVFTGPKGEPLHSSYGYPYPVNEKTVPQGAALCYSLGFIPLPQIPDAMCEDTLIIWEAYRMETELVVTPQIVTTGYIESSNSFSGVEGPQLYFWSVGGQPLQVVGLKHEQITVDGAMKDAAKQDTVGHENSTGEVTTQTFPVEIWSPDPRKNDNTRYYGKVISGGVTPSVIAYGNGSTTPLVDEHGIGILCMHGILYLNSADMLGFSGSPGQPTLKKTPTPRNVVCPGARFFRVHFRQRRVKNPFTFDQMLKSLLTPAKPALVDPQNPVHEVTMEIPPNVSLPPTLEGAVGYVPGTRVTVQAGQLVFPTAGGGSIVVSEETDKDNKKPEQ